MQTSHGLDRVPSTKHVNHFSVKVHKIWDWNLSCQDSNTVLIASISQSVGEHGFKNHLTSIFSPLPSIRLSKGSDSSYISRWIDLCFQWSSPLLVGWLVEWWQIGFYSLHKGAQWSGFDRVKRKCINAPLPPHVSALLSYTVFCLCLSPPWGLENGWPCLTWTTLMSSPLHYCTYSMPVSL